MSPTARCRFGAARSASAERLPALALAGDEEADTNSSNSEAGTCLNTD